MKWYTFVSQTGSEVVALSKELKTTPDLIITNNYKKLSQSTLDFIKENKINVCVLPFNPEVQNYLSLDLPKEALITLHGWLRILPEEFIETHINVFNGHPGLITAGGFPILKGQNPQEKAHSLGHTLIGSVVHRVIAEVDEGEILTSDEVYINSEKLEDYYNTLRGTSLNAWKEFFKIWFEAH